MTVSVDEKAIQAEVEAMWNAQLCEFPTVKMRPDGTIDYFVVEPACGEIKDFDARNPRKRYIDGVDDDDAQRGQGSDLAERSLKLATRAFEADGVAIRNIVESAFEIANKPEHPLFMVASAFVDEVLDAAVRAHD
jgi:hypothetical protein